ncbi:MAG: transporter substrate-binding domain-containing protein, partial [Pseudomonadota bacterium]
DADPQRLAREFNMKLVNSHSSSIEMVALGRMDVAVVTDAYLWAYLARNPAVKDKLLVSDRRDQLYNHRALVRRGGPITVDRVNALLADLEKSGKLGALWRKAGVVR